MGSGKVLYDSEAEAGTAHFAAVAGAIEPLKDAFVLVGGDAAAAVLDFDDDIVALPLQQEIDLVLIDVFKTVFGRVLEQVDDRASETVLVAGDDQAERQAVDQDHALLFEVGGVGIRGCAQQFADIVGLGLVGQRAGLLARKVEDALDQGRQSLGFARDDRAKLRGLVTVANPTHANRLAIHADQREWCLQFVRDSRDQIDLEVCQFGFARNRAPGPQGTAERRHEQREHQQGAFVRGRLGVRQQAVGIGGVDAQRQVVGFCGWCDVVFWRRVCWGKHQLTTRVGDRERVVFRGKVVCGNACECRCDEQIEIEVHGNERALQAIELLGGCPSDYEQRGVAFEAMHDALFGARSFDAVPRAQVFDEPELEAKGILAREGPGRSQLLDFMQVALDLHHACIARFEHRGQAIRDGAGHAIRCVVVFVFCKVLQQVEAILGQAEFGKGAICDQFHVRGLAASEPARDRGDFLVLLARCEIVAFPPQQCPEIHACVGLRLEQVSASPAAVFVRWVGFEQAFDQVVEVPFGGRVLAVFDQHGGGRECWVAAAIGVFGRFGDQREADAVGGQRRPDEPRLLIDKQHVEHGVYFLLFAQSDRRAGRCVVDQQLS